MTQFAKGVRSGDVRRLFSKALFRAVLWTAWMFGSFSLMNWTGLTDFLLASPQFWMGVAAVMTMLTVISIRLDERWAKRRDHAKRMKDRDFK